MTFTSTLKKTGIVVLALSMLISASSCSKSSKKDLESSEKEKKTVMTVGGYDVPYEVYRYVALNYRNQYEKGDSSVWLGDEGAKLRDKMTENIEKTIVNLYAPIVMCEQYGFTSDAAFITDKVNYTLDTIYEGYDYDYETYKKDIAEYNMNDSVYRFLTLNDVVNEELFEAMVSNGDIILDSDYLDGVFHSDEFIRVKQILISFDNGNSDEENLAKANEILTKVKNGDDFDTLVQKYGQDLYMFNNFDGYYMMKGQYYEEFENAAFSLEVGEYSDIIETEAGYSILMRFEKDDEYIKNNFESLTETYKNCIYNTKLEAFASTLTAVPVEGFDVAAVFSME